MAPPAAAINKEGIAIRRPMVNIAGITPIIISGFETTLGVIATKHRTPRPRIVAAPTPAPTKA
jgi:hypothetical protein